MGEPVDRADRLAECLRRLEAAPPCSTAEQALALLSATLNAVEDEMTSIVFDPSAYKADGRLYPPQADAERTVPGQPGIRRYRSVGHNTFIGANGAMRIVEVKGACLLSKAGADGKMLDLLP